VVLRLDLDDKIPHHSTFSENRLQRFRESDIFRHIFERVVAACMSAGLLKGEGFAVDASVMEANASRYHGKAPDEIAWAEPNAGRARSKNILMGLMRTNCWTRCWTFSSSLFRAQLAACGG
jgi:hypothetical protein